MFGGVFSALATCQHDRSSEPDLLTDEVQVFVPVIRVDNGRKNRGLSPASGHAARRCIRRHRINPVHLGPPDHAEKSTSVSASMPEATSASHHLLAYRAI